MKFSFSDFFSENITDILETVFEIFEISKYLLSKIELNDPILSTNDDNI